MHFENILIERRGEGARKTGLITLNRPKQLNALTLEMCQLMLDRFRAWASSAAALVPLSPSKLT